MEKKERKVEAEIMLELNMEVNHKQMSRTSQIVSEYSAQPLERRQCSY